MRAAGRVVAVMLRSRGVDIFRIVARNVLTGGLVAISEYPVRLHPAIKWGPVFSWTACESGACDHGLSPGGVDLAA